MKVKADWKMIPAETCLKWRSGKLQHLFIYLFSDMVFSFEPMLVFIMAAVTDCRDAIVFSMTKRTKKSIKRPERKKALTVCSTTENTHSDTFTNHKNLFHVYAA